MALSSPSTPTSETARFVRPALSNSAERFFVSICLFLSVSNHVERSFDLWAMTGFTTQVYSIFANKIVFMPSAQSVPASSSSRGDIAAARFLDRGGFSFTNDSEAAPISKFSKTRGEASMSGDAKTYTTRLLSVGDDGHPRLPYPDEVAFPDPA